MNKYKRPLKDKGSIVIYEDKKGNVELRADMEHDTIWATQDQIADLFRVSRPNITMHIKNIFMTKELKESSVSKKFLLTATDSKVYSHKFYNLDMIISIGYRVNSIKATKFRIWATGVLRQYLKNGFALNTYKFNKSPELIEGLHEAVTFMQSEPNPGKLKGKMILKITKDFIEK